MPFAINNLDEGQSDAFYKGMNLFYCILLAVQVLVVIAGFVRESGSDHRFEGDKLGFRS